MKVHCFCWYTYHVKKEIIKTTGVITTKKDSNIIKVIITLRNKYMIFLFKKIETQI